ncbi:MAG: NUDIX hydrolase [Acidimicrobiales bacterium]
MDGAELCVGAVVVAADHLLLVRRGHAPDRGIWSIPGGRVAPGETPAEAVVRELAEETGIVGVCGQLLGRVHRGSGRRRFVILDFSVEVSGRPVPVAGDDADQAMWVPLDRIQSLPLVDGLAEFLRDHGVAAAPRPT